MSKYWYWGGDGITGMRNNKSKNKLWEFFRPTKRKIKAYVKLMVILFILSIFSEIFLGRIGCFRVPCEDGTMGYFRTYLPCGTCTEPTLMKDIVGYTTHYFFSPFAILFDIDLLGNEFILFFVLDMFLWYTLVCFYVRLKEKNIRREEPFFKPNKFKIIFLIILGIISLILRILERFFSQGSGWFAEFLRGKFSYLYIINLPLSFSPIIVGNTFQSYLIRFVIDALIEILVLYIFVCMIYSTYELVIPIFKNKIKKK